MWTVALYLAGGENVAGEMIPALHALRDASCDYREVLSSLAQFEPTGEPARLFVFDERLVPRLGLSAPIRPAARRPGGLPDYEHRLDSAASSGELLGRFAETARRAAGDDSLLFVVSGHADGAVGEFLGHRPGRDPIDLRDLRRALEPRWPERRKIDVLGMDCCHMSMIEVACEVRPCARFLVASEGFILNHGWPYREILKALADLPPREAAEAIACRTVDIYSDYSLVGVDADCAVTDLERLPLLTDAVRRLSVLLRAGIGDPDIWRPVVLAHWEAQSYKDEEYVDLADFCDRLRLHIGDAAIRGACADVLEAVERVVSASCCTGPAFQFSTGLSIYFPWCNDAVKSERADAPSELSKYRELVFSRETAWGDFLDDYLSATRRAPRPARTRSERGEMTMFTKRVPPMGTKGSSGRASVKNHPRTSDMAKRAPTLPAWQSTPRESDRCPQKNDAGGRRE